MLFEFYGDMHIHVGRTREGLPVKVTASPSQTLSNVFAEALERKGLDMVGIVDAACPGVLNEIEEMVAQGLLKELAGGGLLYKGKLTIILGAEIESTEKDGRHAHWIAYFPSLKQVSKFSYILRSLLRNPELSTQRCPLPARVILGEVSALDGIFLPAHAFTPHKGVYGQCTESLEKLLGREGFGLIVALELGLSADTFLADCLSEVSNLSFLSNSDAHSLKSIGREFNVFRMSAPNWDEFIKALRREEGRAVSANYGLDPRLGKYHRTFCLKCQVISNEQPPVSKCPFCKGDWVVKGVFDRIKEIGNRDVPFHPSHRPPYYHHVPLYFLPGVGPKTVQKLLDKFNSEIEILHKLPRNDLVEAAGERVADVILKARDGALCINTGGGGIYGKVSSYFSPSSNSDSCV